MALSITTSRDQEAAKVAGTVKAEERICRTADGDLVREHDPRAAFLAYAAGDVVVDAEVDAYRALVDGRTAKASRKPADKAAGKPADK